MKPEKHPIGYIIEPEELRKLVQMAIRLNGASDRERDEGHKLDLIVHRIKELPLHSGDHV